MSTENPTPKATEAATEAAATPETGLEQNPETLARQAFRSIKTVTLNSLPTITEEEFVTRITPGIAALLKENTAFPPDDFARKIGELAAVRQQHEDEVAQIFLECGEVDADRDQIINMRKLNAASFNKVMARTMLVSATSICIYRLCRVDGRELGLTPPSKILILEDKKDFHSDVLCDLAYSRKTGSYQEIFLNEEKRIDKADIPPTAIIMLAKIGREAGPEYAQLVSKIIHKARYGTVIGQESKSKQSKRRTKLKDEVTKWIYKNFEEATDIHQKVTAASLGDGILGPTLSKEGLEESAINPLGTLGYGKVKTKTGIVDAITRLILITLSRQEEPVVTEDLAKMISLALLLGASELIEAPSKESEITDYKTWIQIKAADLGNMLRQGISLILGPELQRDILDAVRKLSLKLPKDTDPQGLSRAEKRSLFLISKKHGTLGENQGQDDVQTCLSNRIDSYSSAIERLSRKPGDTKATEAIHEVLQHACEPAELSFYYNYRQIGESLKRKIIQRLKQLPGYIDFLLENLNLGPQSKAEQLEYGDTGLEMFEAVLEGEEAQSEAYARLIDALINPNYKTYYNAVAVVRHLIGSTEYKEACLKTLGARLFTEPAHLTDPTRLAVYRDLIDNAPHASMQVILTTVMPSRESGSFPSYEVLEEHFGLTPAKEKKAEKAATKKAEKEAEKTDPYKAVTILKAFPALTLTSTRDLDAQARKIVEERSIQISDSGNQVALEGNVGSPLAAIFPTAVVKKDKNALKQSKSLACNVHLDSKDSTRLYCRLNHDGALTIRILEDGTEKATIEKGNTEENGISPRVFEELHYLILSALEIIYVKTTEVKEPKANSGAVQGPKSEPDKPGTKTDIPVAKQRKSGQMKIDLTTHEKEKDDKKAEKERAEIGANLSQLRALFAPLVRGENLDKSDIPAAAEDVILYKKQALLSRAGRPLTGQESFTYRRLDGVSAYVDLATGVLDPEDIYVRTVRAHSAPLPYLLRSPDGEVRFFTTVQAQATDMARQRHEVFIADGNERLNDRKFNGILTFDVDPAEANEKLLLQMQDPVTLRRLTEARIREVEKIGTDTIAELREEERQSNDPARKLTLIGQIQDTEAEVKAQIAEIQKTMQTPDDIWSQRLMAQIADIQSETGAEIAKLEDKKSKKTIRRTKEAVDTEMAKLIASARARVQELEALIDQLPKTSELTILARKKAYGKAEAATPAEASAEAPAEAVIELPQHGYSFNQTFNHGQFISLAEALGISSDGESRADQAIIPA
ncbi:hypothetical protein HY605_05340 [Candidatus Peregrinibacteria bacterium]|nr:hypothetical protein [Candidatus Peregrinibacteria bacterium]